MVQARPGEPGAGPAPPGTGAGPRRGERLLRRLLLHQVSGGIRTEMPIPNHT